MDLQLSHDQRALVEAASQMLARRAPIEGLNDVVASDRGYDVEVFAQIAAMGWLELGLDSSAEEGTLIELGLVLNCLGRFMVPSPFYATAATAVTVARLGSSECRKPVLERLSSGDEAASLVLLPSGSIDSTGDGYVLTGTAIAVEWASEASTLVVVVPLTTDEWALAQVQPGDVARLAAVDVFDHERAARIDFAHTPVQNVLGTVTGAQWKEQRQLLNLLRSAEALGCGERSLELAVAHVKQRDQFGHPIGAFQAVQHTCADIYIDLDAARLLILNALWRVSAGLAFERHAAMASWFTGEAMERVTRSASQIHGGVGVIKDYPLHHCYRHAKAQQLRLGSRHRQLADLADLVIAAAERDFVAEFVRWPSAEERESDAVSRSP